MPILLRPILLAAGVVATLVSLPAVAKADPPTPPPPPPPRTAPADPGLGTPPAEDPTRALRWVEGLSAGTAKGRESGKLLFVVVTQKNPPCPACRGLENRVFSKPDAARISDAYVAVRVLGGEDATPEVEAFMERYGVDRYPSVLAMTPDGALLRKIPTFASDRPLGTEQFLEALGEAAKKDAEFQARRKELLARDDTSSWADVVKGHVERFEHAAARDVHRRILERQPTVDNYGMLAYLDQKSGDAVDERATLETMLAKFPDHPERIEWRIRLTTMDMSSTAQSHDEFDALIDRKVAALEGLLSVIEPEGRLADQSEVHWRIADMYSKKNDSAGVAKHLQWVAEKDPEGRRAPSARIALAFALYQKEELEPALAHLETILAKYPDSNEARQAKDLVPQLKKELEEKRAKKTP